MTRDEVFALIRAIWPTSSTSTRRAIAEETRFKEDLEADSLDLYTLVQELEDTYGVRISDEQAARILHGRARPSTSSWRRPATDAAAAEPARRAAGRTLPEDLDRQVFTHASWTERRSDSYARLAFLGDAVLALAVTTHLYPRLEAERFGAGRLTKIRAQSVSGPACRAVAERLASPSACARPRRPARVSAAHASRPSACWRPSSRR